MKRSKSQAIYKFLPEMWISDNSDERLCGRTATAKITVWNTDPMKGIHESYIESEIRRMLRLFAAKGGDISSFSMQQPQAFDIVEPACKEGIADIKGEISPLLFYCSVCHDVFEEKSPGRIGPGTWICQGCSSRTGKRSYTVKQLQMIYACECGYAQPVSRPYIKGVTEFQYYPNDEPFKMKYTLNGRTRNAELKIKCPSCGTMLLADNAESGRNYKPFHLRLINLVNDRYEKFLKKEIDAQKIIVAQWFEFFTHEEYEMILNHVEEAFSQSNTAAQKREEARKQAEGLVAMGIIDKSELSRTINALVQNQETGLSVEGYLAEVDELFAIRRKRMGEEAYHAWLINYAFKLVQFDTLKYPSQSITLTESIESQKELEFIEDGKEIEALHQKMGILNAQVSSEIEIINCVYGYTRRIAEPANALKRLKLSAYQKTKKDHRHPVYASKLVTEGILFEIDQKRIIMWLYKKGILSEEQLPDLASPVSVKKWFVEYVHGEQISSFGKIEDRDSTERITQQVFSLLHSMSHAFLKTAGELSGLSSNSLGEIILTETASIFIYAQNSQGIPLGALSGLFENNYAYFLKKALEENRSCIYDPVCTERDDTRCMACLLLPEISCSYFNEELGRKYLYTKEAGRTGNLEEGFWEAEDLKGWESGEGKNPVF